MGMRNGFFRLLILEDGTYLELLPPEDGGNPISVEELQEYLSTRGHTLNIATLASELNASKSEACRVKLDNKTGYAESESYILKVSEDKMKVIARFYPCSNAGSSLTIEEIVKDLHFKKIQIGIREDVIQEYLYDRHYCTDYLIAEGRPVKEGTDGVIEYKFNTNPDCRPRLNPDGTVDFHNLDLICSCEKDQVLATLTPAVLGEAGANVFGESIKPRDVVQPSFRYGSGMSVSEDGLSLISQTNGNVSLVDDKVFVSDVYEVTDVDASTGNIDYNGDVRVLGNVKAGYCVQASGSIEVRGVVEGAMVQSDRDVIIGRGMNGMGKGVVIAGNNVVAKFLENSKVQAAGYVHSEAIMNCDITSKSDVIVTGKKGFITGGKIQALGSVEAKTIGSTMGVDTEIIVGTDPAVKLKASSMEQEIAENTKKVNQLKPVLVTLTMRMKRGDKLTDDQIRTLKQMTVQYKELTDSLEKLNAEYDDYIEHMEVSETESVVKVSDYAYPGTKITISEVFTQLKAPAQRSRFVKDGADVRITAL